MAWEHAKEQSDKNDSKSQSGKHQTLWPHAEHLRLTMESIADLRMPPASASAACSMRIVSLVGHLCSMRSASLSSYPVVLASPKPWVPTAARASHSARSLTVSFQVSPTLPQQPSASLVQGSMTFSLTSFFSEDKPEPHG